MKIKIISFFVLFFEFTFFSFFIYLSNISIIYNVFSLPEIISMDIVLIALILIKYMQIIKEGKKYGS